ncbi:MAG: potassium channel family protein [Candidatus Dadabacteria bacterium]|nr:potassium channel family protein [Candidatus Dadabacteria bacterium]
MTRILNFLAQFWSTDKSLTVLLGLLFINIFVLNPLSELGIVHEFFLNDILYSLILISGVMAVAKSRFITLLSVVLAIATILVNWVKNFLPGTGMVPLDTLMLLGFLGMLSVIVLVQVFREGPVTIQRICGAIVVYLLIGLIWALAYNLVSLYQPESFKMVDSSVADRDYDFRARLTYFSYITLTTVGYGDITAVSPVARTLAMLEALIGQLFPVILIARLVSMELYYRRLI